MPLQKFNPLYSMRLTPRYSGHRTAAIDHDPRHKTPGPALECCKCAVKHACKDSGGGEAGAQKCAGFPVPLPRPATPR